MAGSDRSRRGAAALLNRRPMRCSPTRRRSWHRHPPRRLWNCSRRQPSLPTAEDPRLPGGTWPRMILGFWTFTEHSVGLKKTSRGPSDSLWLLRCNELQRGSDAGMLRRGLTPAACLAACLLVGGRARADGPVDPSELSGIERPATRGSEPATAVANLMLWPFRLVVDLIFLATGTAGGLLENEQIVPRARDFFFSRGGELGVFPTVFLETGLHPSIGVRLIASVEPYAATVRAGYGGPDDNVVEYRMRLSSRVGFPAVMSLEGYHDRRTGLGYLGVGQTPETDPRNQFRNGPGVGVFRERRERIVAGFGLRPLADVEVLLSSSLTQRYVDDPLDLEVGPTLPQVFFPSSIPGAFRTTRIVYSEVALRIDSRISRNGVATGVLLEGYGGPAQGIL